MSRKAIVRCVLVVTALAVMGMLAVVPLAQAGQISLKLATRDAVRSYDG